MNQKQTRKRFNTEGCINNEVGLVLFFLVELRNFFKPIYCFKQILSVLLLFRFKLLNLPQKICFWGDKSNSFMLWRIINLIFQSSNEMTRFHSRIRAKPQEVKRGEQQQ
ncbi:unnamed protein product [Paramecium primaurelia]|uniref:Uncharacterized protein n=1 Tax=Paramecium primaurelia TaxID=5886 RepID=A0A8S1KUH0_PARPR|nr:unnamed protein product [Paramecium primaurelia]